MARYKYVEHQRVKMTAEEETAINELQTRLTEENTQIALEEAAAEAKAVTGKQKLKDLGLDDEEIKALTGR